MNKRGDISDVLFENAIYIILAVVFTIGMFLFVWQQSNGAAIFEQYYASEITKAINMAQPGDKVSIDVQKATEIASNNKITDFNQIFSFFNSKNELCIKLSRGRATCMNYYNNVDILNVNMKYGIPGSVLYFEIGEKVRAS